MCDNTYLLTYLLTYSMVQSPSWEANWFAASQEIPRISRNPKVHYRTHKRPPSVSIHGQPNPVHIPTSHLLEIRPCLRILHSPITSTFKVLYTLISDLHGFKLMSWLGTNCSSFNTVPFVPVEMHGVACWSVRSWDLVGGCQRFRSILLPPSSGYKFVTRVNFWRWGTMRA